MPHVEATKNLTAAAEQVWTVIITPETWEHWFMVHGGWPEKPPATLTAGTSFVEKIALLGMTDKLEWNVTAHEEPRKLTLVGTSKTVKVEFSFNIGPADNGCNLSVIGDFEAAGVKGLLAKAVERTIGKQVDKSVEQLDVLAAA